MEIEGEDGTKLSLNPGVKSVFGRGEGFNTDDLTVSRRHVSLELKPSDKVFFEALGRNPVWLRTGDKIRTFGKSETGEIDVGDRICVSGRCPIWYNVKRQCDEVMEEKVSDCESGLESIDYSNVDPVKEFGFLVIGKEFEQYPKSKMRDIKQWEWFLEDFTNGNSDDDDDGEKKGRKGLGKKRGRKKGNEDDDDWGVESEEDKEMVVKTKGVRSANYSTRSKKSKRDTNASSSSGQAQTKQRGSVDDDDETLGGFIVTDEEEDELDIDDDDDEEEVVSDEDEDEDED